MEQLTKLPRIWRQPLLTLPRLFLMPRVHYGGGETNDPAEWAACSTADTAIDALEPELTIANPYREAAILFLSVIEKIDSEMTRSRDARKTWVAVSISLGLHSTSGVTVTQAAAQLGITKQALSRTVASFSRMTGMQPAFGLKSIEARQNYQQCH